jgi:DNA (cytosine-5)-methyltransferase 1
LEDAGYAVGAADLCAAGVGAPHIRQRLWWVGHSKLSESPREREHRGTVVSIQEAEGSGLSSLPACGLGDADDARLPIGSGQDVGRGTVRDEGEAAIAPGPVNGFWRDAQWIGCSDGRWRPVEPGTTALAHGATNRVGRLRGYGNAINAQAAAAFISASIESLAA